MDKQQCCRPVAKKSRAVAWTSYSPQRGLVVDTSDLVEADAANMTNSACVTNRKLEHPTIVQRSTVGGLQLFVIFVNAILIGLPNPAHFFCN